jgi:hypothetical protein
MSKIIKASMAAVFIAGVVIVLAKPSNRPDLLPRVAGCFSNDPDATRPNLVLRREGTLSYQGNSVRYVLRQDKGGVSVLPEVEVAVHSRENPLVEIGGDHPLLMRLSQDYGSIGIPDLNGNPVDFIRVKC